MSENVLIALQITLIGMGLVFAAILVLWGFMAILVRIARETPPENVIPEATRIVDKAERRRRAAVLAVAVALAQQSETNEPHAFPLPPTAIVSAWQAVMRTRMLSKRGPTRRGQ